MDTNPAPRFPVSPGIGPRLLDAQSTLTVTGSVAVGAVPVAEFAKRPEPGWTNVTSMDDAPFVSRYGAVSFGCPLAGFSRTRYLNDTLCPAVPDASDTLETAAGLHGVGQKNPARRIVATPARS